MTFTPFYMGNHVKPYDMTGYTMNENWGGQINFMVPLDKRGLEQCRRIAKRQEEKMRLEYEITRTLKCAELQQKGFMIKPTSNLSPMCSDIIPISKYLKDKKEAKLKNCKPARKLLPWRKQKYNCPKTP